VRTTTWQDRQELADLLPGWVFRGQSEIKWRLQPTLEKFAQHIASDHTLSDIEGHMVIQFKRGLLFISMTYQCTKIALDGCL
jgi:hypothetical protein